jgi:transcriptional regulator GlxA family with amidase domain
MLKLNRQHNHEKLIGKAQRYLSTCSLSVAEIAYQLGFEHSQLSQLCSNQKVPLYALNAD